MKGAAKNGSPAHLGYLAFYFLAPLGTQQKFILFLFCRFSKNNFQSGWRNLFINMLIFPIFPTWLGTYDFIFKIILV